MSVQITCATDAELAKMLLNTRYTKWFRGMIADEIRERSLK